MRALCTFFPGLWRLPGIRRMPSLKIRGIGHPALRRAGSKIVSSRKQKIRAHAWALGPEPIPAD